MEQINDLYRKYYELKFQLSKRQIRIASGVPVSPARCCFVIYVDSDTGIEYYKDADGNWQPVAGGSGGGDFIPLAGTDIGSPVTGSIIEFNNSSNQSFITTVSHNLYISAADDRDIQSSTRAATIQLSEDGFGNNVSILSATSSNGNEGVLTVRANETGDPTITVDLHDINGDVIGRGITGLQDFTPFITDLDYVQKKYVDAQIGLIEKTLAEIHILVNGPSLNPVDENYNTGLKVGAFYKISGVHSGNGTYNSFPALYDDGSNTHIISTLVIGDAGSGITDGFYENVPTINVSGSGQGATLNIRVEEGIVNHVDIVNSGNNYLIGDVLHVSASDIGGGIPDENPSFTVDAVTTLYKGTTIILQALTPTTLSLTGHGEFFNPKYNQTIGGFGIWSNRSTWTVDTIVGSFELNESVTGTITGSAATLVGDISSGLFIVTDDEGWESETSITGDSSGATALISDVTVKSYSAGDPVIWGGYAWTNEDSNVGTTTDILTLDTDNWIKIVYINSEYNRVWDPIVYDYENDLIVGREDKAGNIIRTSKANMDEQVGDYSVIGTPINVFQWGNNYSYDTYSGIGKNIVNGYFDCINFQGKRIDGNSISTPSIIYNNIYIGNSGFSDSEFSYFITNNIFNSGGVTHTKLLTDQSTIQNSYFSGNLTRATINDLACNDLNLLANIGFCTIKSATFAHQEINQNIYFTDINNIVLSGIDLSAATYIFESYYREIYTRPDNTVQIRFWDNAGTNSVHDITD